MRYRYLIAGFLNIILLSAFAQDPGHVTDLAVQVSAPSLTVIVDNPDASFVGTWPTSTFEPGYYGDNYQSNAAGTGADSCTWNFTVPETGSYQVFARWTSSSSRCSNCEYTVTHNAGSTPVVVDQRANGGQWNLLGTWAFNAATGYSVTLTDDANNYVIADAIKLEPN